MAAYLVFFHHFNPFPADGWGWRLCNEGHIGVTLFFVLSGFLIPLRYLDKVTISRQWLTRYFQNRFARIYPLYALLTIITFIFIWRYSIFDVTGQWASYTKTEKIAVPLLNLTFLRGFFDQFKFTGLSQGWTLTVEECFYLTAPPLLLIIQKTGAGYRVLATAALLFTAIGCLLLTAAPHPYGFFGSYEFVFYRTFFGRSVEFMLGAGLALFIRQHHKARQGAWATCVGGLWIAGSMVALSLIATRQLPSWENPVGIMLNNLWLPLRIALFFYGLMTERTWIGSLFETRTAQILGKSSYAFYLVHLGVFSTLLMIYVTHNTLVIFILAVLLALALWKWVEEPLNSKLRKMGRVVQAPSKETSSVQ